MTRCCKDDLLVWKEFLEQLNGKYFFIDEKLLTSEKMFLITDASGVGFGAVFENSWFYGNWNEQWHAFNITVKELYPIIVGN